MPAWNGAREMSALRAITSAAAALAALLSSVPAVAQPTETDVKAAFLPRFARYVTWPAPALPTGSNPFVLCVLGHNPFGNVLASAARSQSVDGRRIVVRQLDSTTGAGQCQIAYVGGSDSQSVEDMLASIRGRPILTVTDSHNGASRGIIHFRIADGRVRFFIDQAGAQDRGISISSRLLALAIAVKQ